MLVRIGAGALLGNVQIRVADVGFSFMLAILELDIAFSLAGVMLDLGNVLTSVLADEQASRFASQRRFSRTNESACGAPVARERHVRSCREENSEHDVLYRVSLCFPLLKQSKMEEPQLLAIIRP